MQLFAATEINSDNLLEDKDKKVLCEWNLIWIYIELIWNVYGIYMESDMDLYRCDMDLYLIYIEFIWNVYEFIWMLY